MKIYDFDEVELQGRAIAEVGPHQNINVVSSPEGRIEATGTKCEHGSYIPATHLDPNRAPYCSICHPYLIKEKK